MNEDPVDFIPDFLGSGSWLRVQTKTILLAY